MSEGAVIKILREHLEGQFPKMCANCKRQFITLREYLLSTAPKGSVMPFDADAGSWTPRHPMGIFTFADCPCGNTLALSTEGMALPQLWALLSWVKHETQTRQITPRELLDNVRYELCQQVLANPDFHAIQKEA